MDDIVPGESWRDRVDTLVGRRSDVWLLAAVVGFLALGALVWWNRGAPARVAPPATTAPAAAATSLGTVVVHVAGAVRHPGLYELPAGARVNDAIVLAGGPRRGALLDALNLAEAVSDGMQILVPERGAATVPPGSAATPGPIDVNSADQTALESIPGIGPVRALAILEYRTQIGQFTSLEDLLEVSGIGPATLEAIRPYVTF